MRIAILGRTHWLLDAARFLQSEGHRIVLVATESAAPEYKASSEDFQKLAEDCRCTFLPKPDINSGELRETLRQAEAEVGVSINWPTLIRRETCESFRHGILNAHTGDLPRFRGNACPNWAIINDEPHVGLCVHAMDPDRVDAGSIYSRRRLPLSSSIYIADVYEWTDRCLPGMFAEALHRLSDPTFKPEKQDAGGAVSLRCHPRRPEDGLIDWRQAADAIGRLVRASSRPFAGAFTYLEGKERVTIWRASVARLDHEILAVPGQIVGSGRNGAQLVACGQGVLEIEEAEIDNAKGLPASNRFRLTSAINDQACRLS